MNKSIKYLAVLLIFLMPIAAYAEMWSPNRVRLNYRIGGSVDDGALDPGTMPAKVGGVSFAEAGYKDTETGKIYTEKEYKAQKKSVERQQKKLRAQGRDDQARKVGKQFNTRNNNPTRLQTGKNLGKKAMRPGGMQKGLAVAGGLTRIASGFAMGEDKTEAVGAGLGQAAGGMICLLYTSPSPRD